ncbi:lipoxygenase family protein [Nocardia sp. NPDC020380]|uniref:lipoxygenase family protein n=1 Tax=Nocardia sp. NPDC020380 TaxID=3364309 RepID=UPI0037A85765
MDRRKFFKTSATAVGASVAGTLTLSAGTAGAAPPFDLPMPFGDPLGPGPVNPLLPQQDPNPAARVAELGRLQAKYVWSEDSNYVHGVPMAASLSIEDLPTLEWFTTSIDQQYQVISNIIVALSRHFNNLAGDLLQPLVDQLGGLKNTIDGVFKIVAPVLESPAAYPLDPAARSAEYLTVQTAETVLRTLDQIRDGLFAALRKIFDSPGLGNFGTVDGVQRYVQLWATMPVPAIAETFHDDMVFARMRVAGPNPMVLRQVNGALPQNFPLDDKGYRSVMAGDSLGAAISQGRLYMIDYAELGPSASESATYKLLTGPGYNTAPMAAFAVPAGGGELQPVAIQCGQDPAKHVMFLRPGPGDADRYWSWQMAKTVVQTADFNHHEWFSHLGRTHLVSEAFCVATRRHLAANHPLCVLLTPHFEGSLFINQLATYLILAPETTGDLILAAELGDLVATAGQARLDWDFYEKMPTNEFAERGVDGAQLRYPYRDDALLIWDAIHTWADDYVRTYYPADSDVREDFELVAWADEIAQVGKIKGFRRIDSVDQLVDVVAMIIFTASAQHSAVNFPQKDLMEFMPFYCGMTAAPAPSATTGNGEADWIRMLPSLLTSVAQLYVLDTLGSLHYRPLGDYRTNTVPFPNAINDPRIVGPGGPLDKFRATLRQAENTINDRNSQREPYTYLLPSGIPNSTNV